MSGPIRVLVMPKDANPYQRLLYEEVASAGGEIRYAEGPSWSRTINLLVAPVMLAAHRLLGYRILHIHWVFQFSLPWAARASMARRVMQWWFWFYLWSAALLGYRIVWTAHDLLPHEQVFSDDRRARGYLIRRAGTVIALSKASVTDLVELGARDVIVIPHGSFVEPYPRTLGRPEARKGLGFGDDDIVFLLIGRIERYKGADILLEAVTSLQTASRVKVVVAGACRDAAYRAVLSELALRAGKRAVVRLERIPDAEMAAYLEAADFAVFPFRAVSNSGSVQLAQSFGLPVLIPKLASLGDVPDKAALRYDPGTLSLAQALERAAQMSEEARSRMGRAGKDFADSMDWSTAARLHMDAYSKLLNDQGGRRTSHGHLS